jgi:heterogeneous nuclear ribonucleoprotein F/H
MVLSREGRASGEAYIELENADDLERAMKKHHQHMGARYIELFKSSRSEMDWTLKAQSRGGGGGGMGGGSEDSGSEAVVRLRGLPFGCTKDDIAQFFDGKHSTPSKASSTS